MESSDHHGMTFETYLGCKISPIGDILFLYEIFLVKHTKAKLR